MNNQQELATIEFIPESGSTIYMSSDGFADQIGEASNKKLMVKGFEKMLIEINSENSENQKNWLEQNFLAWKGNFGQIDDVLVIGFKVA